MQSAQELYDALEAWRIGAAASLRVRSLRLLRQAKQLPWRWIAPAFALALIAVAAFMFRGRFTAGPVAPHAPVTVMIADFSNHTGDEVFNGTLESTLKLALEGAPFIGAYDRTRMRDLGVQPVAALDE